MYPVIAKRPRFTLDTQGFYTNDKGFILPENDYYLLSILNSNLTMFWVQTELSGLRGGYQEFRAVHLRNLPIREIDFTTPAPERESRVSSLLNDYDEYLADSAPAPHPDADDVAHDFLAELAERMTELKEKRHSLNLSLLDHLGVSEDDEVDGDTLADAGIAQPPAGVADSPVSKTADELESLRVGSVEVERESPTAVEIRLSARYKPDDLDADSDETDRWGYTETDAVPALRIADLDAEEADLVEAFVPVAVERAGGFAGFRETATKTNSLVDRLRKLTLPRIDEVRDGLESYRRTKQRADELDEKIEKTDALIDEIVYDLYGLTDEEIEIVEEAVGD